MAKMVGKIYILWIYLGNIKIIDVIIHNEIIIKIAEINGIWI